MNDIEKLSDFKETIVLYFHMYIYREKCTTFVAAQ